MIPAVGPTSSKVLLIGEFPGKDEIIRGIPFIGVTGEILKTESVRAGLDLSSCRLTNLWYHAKDEKGCDMKLHLNVMAKEFKGKKFVLLMGSDLTKALFERGVMDLAGLERKSDRFPGIRFFVSPNPAILLHGPVGEFRLSLNRFVEAINA